MSDDLREKVARAIAEALGDDLDHAFVNKSEWNAARGEKGGRYRDINEPMREDYLAAAHAVLNLIGGDGWKPDATDPRIKILDEALAHIGRQARETHRDLGRAPIEATRDRLAVIGGTAELARAKAFEASPPPKATP